jgi:hypothetical protein
MNVQARNVMSRKLGRRVEPWTARASRTRSRSGATMAERRRFRDITLHDEAERQLP